MSLTVLQVAYPLAPVGDRAVGGAEQVLSCLDSALTQAGHQSIVLACIGSSASGMLKTIAIDPDEPVTEPVRQRAQWEMRRAIDETLRRFPIDLVHMHGIDFHHYLPQSDVPVLATLHLPPAWYPPEIFSLDRKETFLNCVSHSQARTCPPSAMLLPPIENGVPIPELTPRPKDSFALALGRICVEKGFHLAVEACRGADCDLVIAGQLFRYPAHEKYFADELAPRLDCRRRFIGPVGAARKRELLASARCLLVPSLAPETSSLVAMEALACGTPVIAFKTGALCEIVDHGRTGFLVRDAREMGEAISSADRINSELCRTAARQRFSAEQMAAGYLERYHQLARRARHRSSTGAAARTSSLVSLSNRKPGADAVGGYAISEVTSIAQLTALQPQWSALWQRTVHTTPFQSPEWLMPWWRHFDFGSPVVLVVRRNRELLGVVPWLIHRDGENLRYLLWGGGISDHHDGLFADDARPAAEHVLRSLCNHSAQRVDSIELNQLPHVSPLLHAASAADAVQVDDACPVLDLTGGVRTSKPGSQYANVRYYRKRAEKIGELVFEIASADNLQEFLDDLFTLHELCWAARGKPGVLTDESVRQFHREAGPQLLTAGILKLCRLRLAGQPIAALYVLRQRRRACYYIGGYDPARAGLSPGTLLIAHAIENACAEGCEKFDFLRGREGYKYLWGARDQMTYRRVLRPQLTSSSQLPLCATEDLNRICG